ncbi:hypothetical protein PMAYCL1PPCAC_23940 [Pristionchus mayeri]|uniref:WD40 domain-containing protein n=1 Tax=Pristionchus mayeri TaxID=1317129 RepID=A0AAN5I770_9BILA|nr:hypothetical protein PMAYCL1PPCAC_23940 [Pristionchus mayeri]
MKNVSNENKIQIRRRRILEWKGKSSCFICSASCKWIVLVPNAANYLYVCSISSDEVMHVESHTYPVSAVDFAHQDESKFASASTDGEIRVWKANQSGVVHLLSSHHRHKAIVSQLHFHHSKDFFILSSSRSERLLVWDWMNNKISFTVPDDNSIYIWSIDSQSIFSASSTQLQRRESSSGRVLSSYQFDNDCSIPYKMLTITDSTLLLLREEKGLSKLTLHDTTSLNCVYIVMFHDSSCIFPWYNRDLGILTLAHKVDNSIESHHYFDCSPYMRPHLIRRVLISSTCNFHDWTMVSGEMDDETSLSSLFFVPGKCITSTDDEIVSMIHASTSIPSLYLTSIRHAPIVNDEEGREMESLAEEAHSSKNGTFLDSPSTPLASSTTAHSVTEADCTPKEEEGITEGHEHIHAAPTIHRILRDKMDKEIGEESLNVYELKEEALQCHSRSILLSASQNSFVKSEKIGIANAEKGREKKSIGDKDVQRLNGKEDEDEEDEESRASYANMDRFILEETVVNLEMMLRRSERDRSKMQKRAVEMEQDIESLRFELEWKDRRIGELEKLLRVQSSAQ